MEKKYFTLVMTDNQTSIDHAFCYRLFQDFTNDCADAIIRDEDEPDNLNHPPPETYLKLLFFGRSKGCVKIYKSRIKMVNNYFKTRFINGEMNGSVAIARKDLFHQHFVIDFDLKDFSGNDNNNDDNDKEEKRLTRKEFDHYVQIRNTTLEKTILNDPIVEIDNNVKINVRFFIYEIIFILWNILKLDWLPIFILLKRDTEGTFSSIRSGFHIEIPDLILPYHDVDVLCRILRHFIPNAKLLDCPRNYSLFGSQKYHDRWYFPRYEINNNGEFLDCGMDPSRAFDAFNITKIPSPDTKVYGFKIVHNNFIVPRKGYYFEEDNTIPEYQKKRKRDENDDDDHSLDENFLYKIGYAYYNGRPDRPQSLYKYVILNPKEDFTLYKNLSTRPFNLAQIIPNADARMLFLNGCDAERAYVRRNKLKMRVYSSSHYSVSREAFDFNFTNRKIPAGMIDYLNVVKEDEDEYTIKNDNCPFHPFHLKHVVALSEISGRLRDTTYYLMAVYILSEATHCDESSRISREWVASLKEEERFSHIFWDLKEKIRRGILTFNTIQQKWAVLALKILIINNDVVKVEDKRNESQFSYVRTALGSIKIPDVILWYLFNDYPYHSYNEDFYEIMSLYVPIIPSSKMKIQNNNSHNGPFVWDSRNSTWRQCRGSHNTGGNSQTVKMVTDIYPELMYIFNVIIPYVQSIEKNKDGNDKKEEPKKTTLISLISRIESFWGGGSCSPQPIPDIFLCLSDCWFVLGGDFNNELIAINPVPMYLASGISPLDVDSYRIEELYNHMNECPFIQKQLFPIIREILKEDCEQKLRDDLRTREEADRLRDQIDARTDFANHFDDLDFQLDLEVNTDFTSDQFRTRTRCGNYAKDINSNYSRDEYTIQLAETFWRRSTTKELAKLVKTYVLRRVCRSYKTMNTIIDNNQSPILVEYSQQSGQERLRVEKERMLALAEIMRRSVKTHPDMSHKLSEDLEPEEMTAVKCDCAVTSTIMYLLQTFSYDVGSIRYVLGNCVLPALCYGAKLKSKQIYFFLGNTNCGKTQFLKVILSVLDHVAGILSSHTANRGANQDRIHDLGKSCDTARFWFMDEISHKPLNRQLINQITGNSPLFIRTNYSEGQMVQIAPSIFVFGNNKPQFTENCPALLSRCKYFVFRSLFHTGGGEPYSFKYCKFPQTTEEGPNVIGAGMMAFMLHAACHNSSSPFFLYDVMTVVDPPRNVLDSTAIYSPVIDIVRKLCQFCGIREEPTGMIPVQRFAYLINNLNNGRILKWTKIASESDALNFVGQVYVMSKLEIEDELVTIFQGITEMSVFQNDQKIMSQNNKD